MKRILIIFFVLIFVVVAATALHLMFNGPKMRNQPSIKPFQARMPLPAPDAVAMIASEILVKADSLEVTEQNLNIGKTAYGYYCAFCHGENGTGNGPVGSSYIPKPADLTTPQAQNLSDRQLYEVMLSGTGHEPVMERTVDESYRWYLVLYLRYGLNSNE